MVLNYSTVELLRYFHWRILSGGKLSLRHVMKNLKCNKIAMDGILKKMFSLDVRVFIFTNGHGLFNTEDRAFNSVHYEFYSEAHI